MANRLRCCDGQRKVERRRKRQRRLKPSRSNAGLCLSARKYFEKRIDFFLIVAHTEFTVSDRREPQQIGENIMAIKYTNAEIAANLNLWNEYFNPSAMMSDEEFHAMSYDERMKMLVDAFGEDSNEGDDE